MKSIKCLILTLVTISCLLSGCSGSGEVQPAKWTYDVYCDTRGDNDTNNLTKSGVNEAVVNSVARDMVMQGVIATKGTAL